jgi:hypothetical protein
MSKQNKIINKIAYDSGQDSDKIRKNNRNPNDECYTSMEDIVNELAHYGFNGKFKGKNIICPCDWDILNDEEVYSLRLDFDEDIHAHTNVVQSVEYDIFTDTNEPLRSVKVNKDEIDELLRDRTKCNFLRTLIQHSSNWGIKSVTVSGYNPATDRGNKFQDIDFSKYDICITNPPFSMYPEFLSTLINAKIDFVVLAPYLNRSSSSVGVPLFLRQCYLGYGRMMPLNFYNATAENNYKRKAVACDWITTFDDAQKEIDKTRLLTGIKYEEYKEEYYEMENMTMKDGTHPLRMNSMNAIPDDYYGWMFCSISVLTKLSYEEFEWYGTNFHRLYNTQYPELNPFNHRASNEMVSNSNTKGFHGLVLRRKREKESDK